MTPERQASDAFGAGLTAWMIARAALILAGGAP